jgi:hypothetical protein
VGALAVLEKLRQLPRHSQGSPRRPLPEVAEVARIASSCISEGIAHGLHQAGARERQTGSRGRRAGADAFRAAGEA